MRTRTSLFLGAVTALSTLALPAAVGAQTSDATMVVRLAAGSGSQGAFNTGGLLATRVTVFARSGLQSRYSSATGLAGPTTGMVAAGGTFSVNVPNLYTTMAVGAPNPYTIELTWNDTTVRTASYTVGALARGTNTFPAPAAAPFPVTNDAPPGMTSIQCYPQPPRTSTELYVYWSGLTPRPVDFDRLELHRSTTSGFTPSATTLVAMLAYGTANRTDTGLTANTAYYYCIRVRDQYGATTDRCTPTPCRTAMAMVDAGPDVMDVPQDLPRDVAMDTPQDLPLDRPDAAMDAPADRADAAMDVPVDRADAVMDVPVDRADAAMDVPVDRADASMDVAVDRADAAVDAPADRADVSIDLGGMAGFTSTPPRDAPAATPWVYTPQAVSASGMAATGYRATGLPMGAAIDARTGQVTWQPGFSDVGMMVTFTVFATLPGGGGEVRQTVTLTVTCPDNDGDGHRDARCPSMMGDDCDDARADTAPTATERCNGIDDDCDGRVDEGDPAGLCGPAQACDPSTRTCRPTCASASECTAAPRTCTGDGVCALCTPGPSGDATACASAPEGRSCLADSLGGVFCGCNTDADCGPGDSGRVCDTDRHRCVAGCAMAAGRNGCPLGQRCVTGAGGRGACTVDCTSDAVCGTAVPDRPLCPAGATRRCVACRDDGDCNTNTDGRVFCDAAFGRCVACTATRGSQCVAGAAGAACLPGGDCGCNTDADCGGRESGRVCDGFTHQCRAGCRPSGAVGNACPPGATCVSVSANVGRCEVPRDGGADASAEAAVDAGEVGVADAADDGAADASAADAAAMDATGDAAATDAQADGAADAAAMDAPAGDVPDAARPDGRFEGGGCSAASRRGDGWASALWGVALALAWARRRRRDGSCIAERGRV